MKGLVRAAMAAAVIAGTVGCSPSVDLDAAVRIEAVSTGWTATTGDGTAHRVVPTISLRLHNVAEQDLSTLQINAVFHQVAGAKSTAGDFGSGFIPLVGDRGLAASSTSPALTLASDRGYSGADDPADMLKNSHFVDATVDVFGKFGSAQWTKLGQYPIERRLLGTTAQ